MKNKTGWYHWALLVMGLIALSGTHFLFSTEVGTFGYNFTVDGPTTFLLSMSYYNPLDLRIVDGSGNHTPKYAMLQKDFREMKNRGFNCIRIFVNNGNNDWGWSGCVKSTPKENCRIGDPLENFSPFKKENGETGPWKDNVTYLANLKALIGICDEMGIVVDITMWRSEWGNVNVKKIVPTNYDEHRSFAIKFTEEFYAYRNWFFDILNEWDEQIICDDSQVLNHSEKISQIYSIIKAVKAIDPKRKCTASCRKNTLLLSDNFSIWDKNTNQWIGPKSTIQHCLSVFDFFALHERFNSATATNEMIAKLQGEGAVRPIYFQEPSRRYTTVQTSSPAEDDFLNDLKNSSLNGAAGWCLHNGNSNCGATDIPKSFYLNYKITGDVFNNFYDQGLLFVGHKDNRENKGQLDEVELVVANQAHAQIPFIEVISPEVGAKWVLDEIKTISWSYQNIPDDALVEIGVMKNTPNGYIPAGLINTQIHLNAGSFSWQVGRLEENAPALTAGEYKLCVQAKTDKLHIENGANFSFLISSIIIGSAGSNGTVTPASQIVDAGGSSTFLSQPAAGYQIKKVLINNSLDVTAQVKANGNRYTFTNVQTNQSLAAQFQLVPTQLRVTSMVLNWTGGAITQTAGPIVSRGSNVPFHYLAEPGYILHHIGIHASPPPSPLIAQYTIDEFTGWWTLYNVQQDLWVVFAFVAY